MGLPQGREMAGKCNLHSRQPMSRQNFYPCVRRENEYWWATHSFHVIFQLASLLPASLNCPLSSTYIKGNLAILFSAQEYSASSLLPSDKQLAPNMG